MTTTIAEDVKTFVSEYGFINSVKNVKFNSMFGSNTVEVEVWANCRADNIRKQMMGDLETKFPGNKFNLVFYYNIAERGEG